MLCTSIWCSRRFILAFFLSGLMACGGPQTPEPKEGTGSDLAKDSSSGSIVVPDKTESLPPEELKPPEKTEDAAPPPEPPKAPVEKTDSASISCEPPAGRPPPKGKLVISIDSSTVDLNAHTLQVKLNRPACKVTVKVIGESGTVLTEEAKAFNGMSAGTALMMGWTPSSSENVARIEVWGYDTEGFHIGMAITPWNVSIPHEEVNFANDSDVIQASEEPKLSASLQKVKDALAKHKDLGNISFYIVGHTDTMGPAEHNLGLSRRRARSIASWFRGHGLRIPIAYEGMGEHSPLVKTADETPEAKNRRVDYILSLEPPKLPQGAQGFGWKGI